MHSNGYVFMIDTAATFFSSLRVAGWFHHPQDPLVAVTLSGAGPLAGLTTACGIPYQGVPELGPDKGFELQALLRQAAPDPRQVSLRFTTASGQIIEAPLAALLKERAAAENASRLYQKFIEHVAAQERACVLDLGGRARSDLDRAPEMPGERALVFDLHPGPNVDVVGDAHRLSDFFPAGIFDAILSVSVFEHLAMPWKVAVEMNRVLRPGGIAFVQSHQALGLHDVPWDFWRFSDAAWQAIFNPATGFKVLETSLTQPMFLVPCRGRASSTEASTGFESSAVLVRKTGEARLDWDLDAAALLSTTYPTET